MKPSLDRSTIDRAASRLRALLFLWIAAIPACQGTVGGGGDDEPPPSNVPGPSLGGAAGTPTPGSTPPAVPEPPAFLAQPPEAYVSKVKDLLTGQAATAEEIGRVRSDPASLAALIEDWQRTPAYRQKMQDWFGQAFQQVQIQRGDLADQLSDNPSNLVGGDRGEALLFEALRESFARTVMALVDEGRPFTEVLTTRRFMLTPPLMTLLAYLDALPIDDDKRTRGRNSWILQRFQNLETTLIRVGTASDPPHPLLADVFDPTSPNFMHFPFAPVRVKSCLEPKVESGPNAIRVIEAALFGLVRGCRGRIASAFTTDDWKAWRMVDIRRPVGDEERTLFWDVARMKDPDTKELVLGTERVGFMTTLAFFANWATNDSNAFRVTANQTLITALALTFEPEGPGVPIDDANVEGEHAAKGTVCYGCHVTLDPMRDFFRQSYSLYYSERIDEDSPEAGIPPVAQFTADDSAPIRGARIGALAEALAAHPRFPLAWALKLCQHANAGICLEDDPELLRIADAFRDSGYKFPVLVREVFSSPLVTFAARTKTGESTDAVMSVARREIFCDRLSIRLDMPDLCNLKGKKTIAPDLSKLALGIPSASYARGDVSPVVPKEPNLFYAVATEAICQSLSMALVDNAETGLWSKDAPEAAIVAFADELLGLATTDPTRGKVIEVLQRHHSAAVAQGSSATDALRSTFMAACVSPLSTSLGI